MVKTRDANLSAFQRQELSVRGREDPLNVYVVERTHMLPVRTPKEPNTFEGNWLSVLMPNFLWRPTANCSRRLGHCGKAFRVVILVAKGQVDHRQTFEVVTNLQLVSHTHTAMHLDRVLADKSGTFANLRLRGGN